MQRRLDGRLPVAGGRRRLGRPALVYLVSGWHDRDNVPDVQVYDPARDRWSTATPIPGAPVFGHAGALARDALVYLDGVRTRRDTPRFAMEAAAWRGEIARSDPDSVAWARLAAHPGPALYRAASGSVGPWVIVYGGTDNPYNYNGIGYDGRASVPRAEGFAFNVESGRYLDLPPLPTPSMDHRGLIVAGQALVIVGGMGPDQEVTDRVWTASLGSVLSGPLP